MKTIDFKSKLEDLEALFYNASEVNELYAKLRIDMWHAAVGAALKPRSSLEIALTEATMYFHGAVEIRPARSMKVASMLMRDLFDEIKLVNMRLRALEIFWTDHLRFYDRDGLLKDKDDLKRLEALFDFDPQAGG